MRLLLYLFVGPSLGLLVGAALGVAGWLPLTLAALAGQAASLAVVIRLERRRYERWLRELHHMRRREGSAVSVGSAPLGPLSATAVAIQVCVRVVAALLVTAALLLFVP